MYLAHLHLLLNHFPAIGTLIGVVLLVISLVGAKTPICGAPA